MRPPTPSRGAHLDRARLDSIDYRRSVAVGHAMRENRYLLDTVVTDAAYDLLYARVSLGSGGLTLKGIQRLGKTRCAWRMFGRMAEDFPTVPVDLIIAKDDLDLRANLFYRDLAGLLGHDVKMRPYDASWQQLLVNHFASKCMRAGSCVFYLLVDEAQCLTMYHLRHLFHLCNALELLGFTLATVLIGQNNLNGIINMTTERGHAELMGRFFVTTHDFIGLRAADELQSALKQYDAQLFYPASAMEWPYTRFYMADAFDGGWRLEHEAEPLWAALLDTARVKCELEEGARGFGMTWICKSVHHFLVDGLAGNCDMTDTKSRWMRAIEETVRKELLT